MNESLKELIKIRKLLEVIADKRVLTEKQLKISDELRNKIREWNTLQIRAINERKSDQQKVANDFREKICKKYNITISDIVTIAEGRAGGEKNGSQG